MSSSRSDVALGIEENKIIPGCLDFEWSVVDKWGEKGQRGQQTRES